MPTDPTSRTGITPGGESTLEVTRFEPGGTIGTLHFVSRRWLLPVVAALLDGPRRFGDLKAALPGVSANVLTLRLQELEQAGAVRRRMLPPPARVYVYELTGWGQQCRAVLEALLDWSAQASVAESEGGLRGMSVS